MTKLEREIHAQKLADGLMSAGAKQRRKSALKAGRPLCRQRRKAREKFGRKTGRSF
jgi:hypothetical protein